MNAYFVQILIDFANLPIVTEIFSIRARSSVLGKLLP